MPDIALDAVTRSYGAGDGTVHALRGVDLLIGAGEFVAVVGPSGAGKSTILNLVSVLDAPTTGRVTIDGQDPTELRGAALARLRSATFAFVFQGFHLMESQTVLENTLLGVRYRAMSGREQVSVARAALAQVGLSDRADERARNLSGGQRQRVAIARALASGAPVLVADEPTGNLDSENAAMIGGILRDIARSGRTVVLVTHDDEVAAIADRQVRVRDGLVVEDVQVRPMTAVPPLGPRPGRDSRLRFRDLLADAWASISSQPARYLALVVAVALGVGLTTATFGLGASARAQVASTFDVQRNRQVSAAIDDPAVDLSEYVERVDRLSGVSLVGGSEAREDAVVTYGTTRSPAGTRVYGVTDAFPRAARQDIRWIDGVDTLGPGQALVGRTLADDLVLGPVFAGPRVQINGQERTVVGIIEDSSLEPEALRGVTVRADDEALDNPLVPVPTRNVTIRLLAVPGAAQQIGAQLPLALAPLAPESVQVDSPPDPVSQRGRIESTVATTMTALSIVSVLAAVVSLVNAMTMSVLQRSREFGLRRALGARAAHLRRLVLSESAMVGVAGGVGGLFLGLVGVLVTSIARGWAPVFDPVLGIAAVAIGIVVAVLAGTVAGWRAGRIQPVDALRL